MDIQDFKTTRFNIVGLGTKLTGELHLSGMSSISGEVRGDVFGEADALIVVERTGSVTGSLTATQVEIQGHFEGKLRVSGTLTIKAGSRVRGEISAGQLVIYPGASVDSECNAG